MDELKELRQNVDQYIEGLDEPLKIWEDLVRLDFSGKRVP